MPSSYRIKVHLGFEQYKANGEDKSEKKFWFTFHRPTGSLVATSPSRKFSTAAYVQKHLKTFREDMLRRSVDVEWPEEMGER